MKCAINLVRYTVAIMLTIVVGFANAGGSHGNTHSSNSPDVKAIAGAASAAEAKATASALADQQQGQVQGQVGVVQSSNTVSPSNGASATNKGVNVGGNRSYALGMAAAPQPTDCVIVLPEAIFTIYVTNRYGCGIAVARTLLENGFEVKGMAILDDIAKQLDLGQ